MLDEVKLLTILLHLNYHFYLPKQLFQCLYKDWNQDCSLLDQDHILDWTTKIILHAET